VDYLREGMAAASAVETVASLKQRIAQLEAQLDAKPPHPLP